MFVCFFPFQSSPLEGQEDCFFFALHPTTKEISHHGPEMSQPVLQCRSDDSLDGMSMDTESNLPWTRRLGNQGGFRVHEYHQHFETFRNENNNKKKKKSCSLSSNPADALRKVCPEVCDSFELVRKGRGEAGSHISHICLDLS